MQHVPSVMLNTCGLLGTSRAIFTNSSGHWPGKANHVRCKDSLNGTRSTFGLGWRAFHLQNNLKAGDVCIFEFPSKDKNVVYFFVSQQPLHR